MLTAAEAGTALTGTYEVPSGVTTTSLTVSSFTTTATDLYGNTLQTTVPTGSVFSGKTIAIDTLAPATTITDIVYTDSGADAAGTLVLTGANFTGTNGLGVTQGDDAKSYLNWDNIVWQATGTSGSTSVTFAVGDITSAIVTNSTTMTITLGADKNTALKATADFAAQGGAADSVVVTNGFIKDIVGNVSTTDGGTITQTYADSTRPEVASFSSSTENGSYNLDEEINITATVSEEVVAGSVITAVLGTGDQINLTASAKGYNLEAVYTVGSGDNSSDLKVSSFSSIATDIYGNSMTSTVVPVGENLSDNKALVVDTIDLEIKNATAPNVTDKDGNSSISTGDQVLFEFYESVGKITGSDSLDEALAAILGDGGRNVNWATDNKSVTFDATTTTLNSYSGSFEDLAGNTTTLTFTLDII